MTGDIVARNADCQRFRSELPEFLEGSECAFVQQHALGCAACAALLADLQLIRHEAAALTLEEPAPSVWAGIQHALAAMHQPASPECLRFAEALPGYLEGEEIPFINRHAADCKPCGALLADMEVIQRESAALLAEDPSPALWERIEVSLDAALAEREAVTEDCRRFHLELADYLEGVAHPFVSQHSTECPYCAACLADLEVLRVESRALPQAEEVSPVVWANIRARLEADGLIRVSSPWWQKWLGFMSPAHARAAMGALAALAILGAVVLVPMRSRPDLSRRPNVAAVVSTVPGIDENLVKTVSDMEATFRGQEDFFEPSLKETYDKGLASLNNSIDECTKSVRENPENSLAHEYLVAAYTQKAQLLSSAIENYAR